MLLGVILSFLGPYHDIFGLGVKLKTFSELYKLTTFGFQMLLYHRSFMSFEFVVGVGVSSVRWSDGGVVGSRVVTLLITVSPCHIQLFSSVGLCLRLGLSCNNWSN